MLCEVNCYVMHHNDYVTLKSTKKGGSLHLFSPQKLTRKIKPPQSLKQPLTHRKVVRQN